VALSIKRVNCIFFWIIHALDGEIPCVTAHFLTDDLTNNLMLLEIPDEMVMNLAMSVEEIYKNA
jgi:hypothetical protein